MIRKMTLPIGVLVILAWCLASLRARPSTASTLLSRGYAVIPQLQTVQLKGKDFALSPGWRLELARRVSQDDIAVSREQVSDEEEQPEAAAVLRGSWRLLHATRSFRSPPSSTSIPSPGPSGTGRNPFFCSSGGWMRRFKTARFGLMSYSCARSSRAKQTVKWRFAAVPMAGCVWCGTRTRL